ncbi:MAG: UDP-3-O-acyl-N-acetylglucosamine deacetylase [Pseudomonadota bacterium]|nr:MAG: UDP-3-O-acyl-N-acetylglucosamine deacetylase [Pseudomonadota bacterium]
MSNNAGKHNVMQKTLRQAITYVGVGLHSGRKLSMTVRPGEADSGVYFLRKDVAAGEGLIAARWYNVVPSELSTVIRNEHGVTVATVEHLLAALRGCGVDNAVVELDGPEVPIMDGSSEPFVSMIERVGTVSQDAPRKAIWIQKPLAVRDGDKFAILMPDTISRITVAIEFDHQAIGAQTMSVALVNEAFRRDVARARTFGFAEQVENLKSQGLILGGSLRNAVLVDGDRIVNEEGLRYDNEFVRHKVLDCLGDLSLAGVQIIGHLYAYKPGHQLNTAVVKEVFEQRDAWSYLAVDELDMLLGRGEIPAAPSDSSEANDLLAGKG